MIYILDHEESNFVELTNALIGQNIKTHQFNEITQLLASIEVDQPSVIIASTGHLSEIEPLVSKLDTLKSSAIKTIPLVYISDTTSLQLRLDAMRNGGNAYFSHPMDHDDVAKQIIALSAIHNDIGIKVLIVEDDPTQAEFAEFILGKASIITETITEPMTILETLRSFKPDLILMDLYMPEVNGIELTSVIREYDEFTTIPIVFLSGEQDSEKQVDALSVGGDDFITKPIRPKHLLSVIENRIKRSRQLLKFLGASSDQSPATGLLTKQSFITHISQQMESQSDSEQPVVVILITADDLDSQIEAFGANGSNYLIAEITKAIKPQLNKTDIVARINNSHIALLIQRSTTQEVNELFIRLHESVEAHSFHSDPSLSTLTIGIGATLNNATASAEEILSYAASALTTAQDAGPSKTYTHNGAEPSGNNPTKTVLSDYFSQALGNNDFHVRYQPLLDLHVRGQENYEAILSLNLPNGDLIEGRQIRHQAEKLQVSEKLDKILFTEAISMLKERKDSGRQTHIFVRQSAASITKKDYPAWVEKQLASAKMDATGLVLDFRLSDLSSDLRAAKENCSQLRKQGISISLSRFPEKSAAFKVLKYLKASYINIAPSLLQADHKTISHIIQSAHKSQVKIIVANIDDPRSINLQWSSGADFLQGDFIQCPLDNMDFDFSQVVM